MNLDTEDEFFPQESPLESCFAPKPVSAIVLKEFTESVRNRENPDNEISLDLPLNSKESCTLELDLEIECHSEPLIARRTQSKSGLVSTNPASSIDNSTLPVGAAAVSPQNNYTTLQPLHGNSPSTSAPLNCAKNILGNRATDAAKMVSLRVKGDSSAPAIMCSPDKLAALKQCQEKGVVCTVQLAQQKQINLSTSSPELPRPIPKPSLYLKSPTSAPISSAESTVTTLKPNIIGLVPNQSMSLPVLTMNGLLPGSQQFIVTSLNSSSDNNLVLTSSPYNITSTDTRVTNMLPSSVAYHKTPTGYQALGSQVYTSVPVTSLSPISYRISKTIDPILHSGSTIRAILPKTIANPAASMTGVTPATVTGSTSRASSKKHPYLLAHVNGLMNKKLSPTPVKPIAPKGVSDYSVGPRFPISPTCTSKGVNPHTTSSVRAITNKKTTGKLPPTSIRSREVVAPMVQPDGSVLLMKKTVLCPIETNDKSVNSDSFTVEEESNNPSETGVAKKFVVCPTSAVPVSTAAQFTASVSSSVNILNSMNNGSIHSSPGTSCGDQPIDKRLHGTSVLRHQPSGESPSPQVGPRVVNRLVSRHSQTETDESIRLSHENDHVAHEISPSAVPYTKKSPDISAERISSPAEDMKIPIPVSSSAIKGSFQWHHYPTGSTNLDPNSERNSDTKEDPDLSAETISCVEHIQDVNISLLNNPSLIEGPFQWHHPSTVSSTSLNNNDESNNLHESHYNQNHEIIPSSVVARSPELHAPPMHFKIVQNCQFSEMPNKKRKNRAQSVNYPPTKKKRKKHKLEVKKACFDNASVPTTTSQPFGLFTSTIDLMSPLAQKQMEDQLDRMGDCGASLDETALQWHHPCTDPLECSVEVDSMVTEELDVTPNPENPPGTHKMVSLPVTSHSPMTINLSANIPQSISSSGQTEIAKYEVEDELEQKEEKIETKERTISLQAGNSDSVARPGACSSGPGTAAGEDSIFQIEPVSSVIKKIAIQSIPEYSEVESAVQCITGDYSSKKRLLLSDDDDDDDDDNVEITSQTKAKLGSQDGSYSPQPTAESIFIKNDLDIPIDDSIHSSSETALQCHPSKNTESAIKTESPSDSECSQSPSTSTSFMRNQTNAEIKIAIQSIPGNSEEESGVQHIPGDPVNEEPVLLPDDDDDDYRCAIPSPRSIGSTEEKHGGPDDSYSVQPTAENILIKDDIPIIVHGSIQSSLRWRNPSKNTEPAVKAQSLKYSECNQALSTSPPFMGNPDNAVDSEEKYTPRSELGLHVHRSEEDIHNIDLDTVSSTAIGSCASGNPSSSTRSRQVDDVPARPVYPNAMLKWNRDRIHKIQLNLKRRLKKRLQGQIGSKDTRPKKSQKQCEDDDRPSSSGCKIQKDSLICEVVSNVLQDCIMRKTIQDCYSKKLIPSIQMIHDACCDSGLDFSKETLQPYLNSIGFNWVSCHSGRLLVEDPRFTTKRIEYLDQLEAYSDKNLVYLFVSDLVARTAGWQTYPYSAKECLDSKNVASYVVMHAMNNTSLIDGSLLVLKFDQYKMDTNRIGYWLKNIVLPKVPKGSVVILGDGIFELTVEAVERPHMGHSKAKIVSWLKSHKVSLVNPDLPKAMLLSKAYDVDVPKTSIFDQTIRQSGFEILYLPKHHKDLNPIEFLWQDILDKLNKSPDVKDSSCMEDFVEQEFFSCSQKVTSVASHLVKKFEATYRDFDFCFDELFDSMTSIVGPVGDEIPKEHLAKTPKTSIPVTNPNLHTCPVCRIPAKLTGFRCFKCKFFWKNLVRNYKKGKGRALPVCKMYRHVSTRPPTCNGCRRNQYELALLKTYPDIALPLPPVTYKGEKHSRSIPFKTYPEISEDPSFQSDEEFKDSV